ncbi:MAG: hypothetical protein HC889_06850 [Synechococcaceae cyanobacterium SM1_2_3]|nr:hypothetical protein [Synechococcaceae cyanobacterium SM1_2_3]
MLTTHPDALIASDYVICAMLRKVADVFSVELLWQPSRRRPEGITLLEALQRCPRTPPDRQRKQTCYSHIIVRIPERDYVRDDRLEDGLGRLTLLRELQRLHQQELGDALAERAPFAIGWSLIRFCGRARCNLCLAGRSICRQ